MAGVIKQQGHLVTLRHVNYKPPGVLLQQRADEILSLLRNLVKALLIKLPLGCCDQGKGFRVVVTLEWRLAAEPEENERQHGY